MTNSTRARLFCGTVCVPSLDAALALYVDLLEQNVVEQAVVSGEEALAWQAPAVLGARSAVLQPPSGAKIYLRLVEQATPAGYHPGRHFGWSALELTVASADKAHARLVKAGTPIIAPPKELSFTDKLYPMQARGTGGEAIYLNEVRGNLPTSDLPMAKCWVDQLFIAVMGCRRREDTLTFYNALLGTGTGGTWDIEYSVLNQAFDLPSGTTHVLSTVSDDRTVLFEIDQYPKAAMARPQDRGALVPGICNIGIRVESPPAGANWLVPPAVRANAPYFGATVGVVRGPDGELTELIWQA
ncbi:MAG: hypothetical protein IPP88_13425 [Betaproteobacteria bacterium]|nr:hypothetical protein [Betaproteobacteria bacterium]